MEQGGRDRFHVEPQVSQDTGDLLRMDDIGLARPALLIVMRRRSTIISTANELDLLR
jgi:hypothetical protein